MMGIGISLEEVKELFFFFLKPFGNGLRLVVRSQTGKKRMGSFPKMLDCKMDISMSKKRSKPGSSHRIDFRCFLDGSL